MELNLLNMFMARMNVRATVVNAFEINYYTFFFEFARGFKHLGTSV